MRMPQTAVELGVRQLAGAIFDKVDWWHKSEFFLSKWMDEAEQQGASSETVLGATRLVNHCLQYFKTRPAPPAAVQGTFAVDSALDADLHDALCNGFETLRRDTNDWHPYSNGQVLDLLHPSLFCFEKSVTLIAEQRADTLSIDRFIGVGSQEMSFKQRIRVVLDPSGNEGRRQLQNCFQPWATPPYSFSTSVPPEQDCSEGGLLWLPTNLVVENETTTFKSCINNLDPKQHPMLYKTLGAVFAKMVPVFEAVLIEARCQFLRLVDFRDLHCYCKPDNNSFHTATPVRERGASDSGNEGKEDQCETDEDEDEDDDDEWWSDDGTMSPTLLRDVVAAPALAPASFSLRNRNLQVIFKMGSIELTPENPKYPGGSWHIEGVQEERIVATCIYYLEQTNVTASHLQFRASVEQPQYTQDEFKDMNRRFGMETTTNEFQNESGFIDGDGTNQNLGSCSTTTKRLLGWPNTLQHCVSPFELDDPTKHGRRSILVAFLVDPHVSLPLSTASVPPQQRDWMTRELLNTPILFRLPPNCFRHIVEYLAFGMSLEEAKQRRLRLMDERKKVVKSANAVFERRFGLCEH
jgi:hypothetical protein